MATEIVQILDFLLLNELLKVLDFASDLVSTSGLIPKRNRLKSLTLQLNTKEKPSKISNITIVKCLFCFCFVCLFICLFVFFFH